MASASTATTLHFQEAVGEGGIDATEAITELQLELQNAIALSLDLKQENVDLKRQISDGVAFARSNQQRHAHWKEAWKKERDIVFDREKQLERREQVLEARIKELQEAERKSHANCDYTKGGIHQHLLKEIQENHTTKVDELADEANKWKGQLCDARKNYEGLQSMNSELRSQIERERDVAEAIRKEFLSLQQAFANHVEGGAKEGNKSATSEGIVRDLRLQLEEKGMLVEKLRLEVNEIRQAKDDVVYEMSAITSNHQTEYGKVSHECSKYQAKVKALERRIASAEKDDVCAAQRAADIEEALVSTRKELEHLKDEYVAKEAACKKGMEMLRKETSKVENEMKRQLSKKDQSLLEEKERTKELECRCIEAQELALREISGLKESMARDDHSGKLLVANNEILKLENIRDDMQSELEQLVSDHQINVQRLQHACETCHKDLNLVLMEKKDIEKKAEAERDKAEQKQKEFDRVEHELLKMNEKCQVATDEKETLAQRVDELTSAKDFLESRVKGAMEEVDALKRSSSQRARSEKALHNELARCEEKLTKERRRSEAYKSKATEAHEKKKIMMNTLCGTPK